MNEYLHVKGGVEVYHGVCGVEHHGLTKYLVDLASAQRSYWSVGSARETQLLVLSNTLKHLEQCGGGGG